MRQALIAGGALLLAAAVAGGGWFVYQNTIRAGVERAAAAQQAEAQVIAERVGAPLSAFSGQLLALGKQPEIIALFEQRDAAALAAAAATHTADFPSALKLRLLLPRGYSLEPDAKPPLSFASLDMLANAERSTTPVAAEAHVFGTPEQHIVVIRRVTNQADQLIGLLHLSLDVGILEAALSGAQIGGGYVELQQSAGGQTIVLAKAGPGSSDAPVVVSVPGTRWNLAYWSVGAAPAGSEAFAVNWVMVGGGILLVIVVSAGIVFWIQRPSVTIAGEEPRRKSGVVYAGAVKAIMEGAHPGMEQLVPNLPRFGLKGPVMPVSHGMTGDDITMIARRDTMKPAAKPAPKTAAPQAEKPAVKSPARPAPRPAPVAGADSDPTDPPQKKSPQ
jgi:hypothetical protein